MNPDEITPPNLKNTSSDDSRDAAVNVIRSKLDAIYQTEPDAKEEAKEIASLPSKHLSKHQRYMKELTESGKDTAQVQTAWHEYYQNLPEAEKHEVWQEFYQEQDDIKKQTKKSQDEPKVQPDPDKIDPNQPHYSVHKDKKKPKTHVAASTAHINRIRKNHHVKSLLFGMSMGLTVVFILLFSFFNERFLVPFIRPSQNVSATPIIVDPNSTGPVGPESKIIIPKINLEAPVIYDVETIEEDDIQQGLENGVVHYPTTPNPGEQGNAVIFGHSSGNILNKGKYKFAFILLRSLENGDTFIVQKDGKRYVYKVYNKYVTSPTDFSVLGPTDRDATMTLITCDPPGTSTNRLIIQAEQIFPEPSTNKKSTAPPIDIGEPEQLPSNSQSLWQRITNLF